MTTNETVTLPEQANLTVAIAPTRKIGTARLLFGTLNVPGVAWVKINFGLNRIECSHCKSVEFINEEQTLRQFRNNIQKFASYHSECLDLEKTQKMPLGWKPRAV